MKLKHAAKCLIKGEFYFMTKNDLNKYLKDTNKNVEIVVKNPDDELTHTIVFKTLDFATVVAIANNISNMVVTDFGDYKPELKELLLLYHVLKESSDIKIKEFNVEEMFKIHYSEIGCKTLIELLTVDWMRVLLDLINEKIEYRKSILCNPNNIVNQKLSTLIDKELEVQIGLHDSVKYMEDLSQNFTVNDMSEFMLQIQEFTKLMQDPERNDKFFSTIQQNAQDKRLKEADKIIKLNEARNVIIDVTNEK